MSNQTLQKLEQGEYSPETGSNFVDIGTATKETISKGTNILFREVTYTVKVERETESLQLPCLKEHQTKVILANVSGIFKAGEMSAILGPSGAGKTSLLNIIACRIDRTEGKLLANTTEYDYNKFGDFANYVMQTDMLMQTLTVRETLMFAADLILNLGAAEKERKIMRMVKDMKLDTCLDILVGGSAVKGISGGEKKRCAIAFELISDPQVLILDEPTSGLDSLTSFIIVDYLRKLAHEQGKTVLMTIHQPNSDIYRMFDRLFLMVEGRIIYQGAASKAIGYFSEHFGLTCDEFHNPSEFLIEHIHQQNKANVERYQRYFEVYNSEVLSVVSQEMESVHDGKPGKRSVEVGMCSKLSTLLRRDYINILRNPMLFKSRLFQFIFLGLYLGGLYFDVGDRNYTDDVSWAAISGFLFEMNINCTMNSLTPIALVFPLERDIFLKEENSRMYGVLPYFLSRNIIEIPYLLVMPLIFIFIFYWMVGLASTVEQFLLFYLISFLVNLVGNSIGLLLGTIVKDAKSLTSGLTLLTIPFVLFSGFYKNSNNIPSWIGWVQYISPIKYGFVAMVENQVRYRESNIAQLNFDVTFWQATGALIGLGISFRVLSLFFLWFLRTRVQS